MENSKNGFLDKQINREHKHIYSPLIH